MSVTVSAVIRWAVCDPDSGALNGDGADEQLPAASTIKLFVASAFWRSRLDPYELVGEIPPAGSAGLAEYVSPRARLTLGDLALAMLAVSDNAATNVLLDRLGLDAVNQEIARLGLERTHVRRRMMGDGPENVTTAGDLARGLAALADPRPRPPRARRRRGDRVDPPRLSPRRHGLPQERRARRRPPRDRAARAGRPPTGRGDPLEPARSPARAGVWGCRNLAKALKAALTAAAYRRQIQRTRQVNLDISDSGR
jgi:hypothetical protein